MQRLWAPWRINYVKSKLDKGCIFCKAYRKPVRRFVIFKTQHSIAMLNIFPYNNGHMMVAPRRHIKDLAQLTESEQMDLLRSLVLSQKLLQRVLKPEGYNIGINISSVAGSGIPGHLHIHIVPRWKGDTNFMPVLFATKVISQSLRDLELQLRKAYADTTS